MAKIPINIVTGNLQTADVAVGIDLGTTNSLISYVNAETQQPQVITGLDGEKLVPSIVYYNEDGTTQVGNDAKPFLATHPQQTIYSAKQFIGRRMEELPSLSSQKNYYLTEQNGNIAIQTPYQIVTPVQVAAHILSDLKDRAAHMLRSDIKKAVITVPAYFNDDQRQATRDAGKLAGLDVLRIINEPTAASLAYGFGQTTQDEKLIAVYDLGGGTFDISILRLLNGVFEVLSTHGNTSLGGDDFDDLIIKYWITQNPDLLIDVDYATLRQVAEEAKKQLSKHNNFSTTIDKSPVEISRQTFNELITPLVNETIHVTKQALKDAELKTADIDEIIMVGGSTRVPLVKSEVASYFGKPVNDQLNPDEVVALGAAIQANILMGNTKDVLLLDVTPLSLGIETIGSLMDVMIPRNTKIPASFAKEYTTQVDGQTAIKISVYQGERDLVTDNRLLATFNLSGIPAMPAGLAKVSVQFTIDADGILTVSAKELRSGVQQTITVHAKNNLADTDVEKMLADALTHAQSDVEKRALIEAVNEAQQLITTTESFVNKNKSLLTETEISQTQQAITNLKQQIELADKKQIQTATAALNKLSTPYAHRIMNTAINSAMKGKKI